LRMRRTLNKLVDKPNFALRNFSQGASRLAAVRRMANSASCAGEANGRVCLICWAKLLGTLERLFVETTIVKRTVSRSLSRPTIDNRPGYALEANPLGPRRISNGKAPRVERYTLEE